MRIQNLIDSFKLHFESSDMRVFFAPGRINLIGEHIDYNGGHVFPCALSLGTYCLARKRDDRKFRMYSENFPEKGIIEFDLDTLDYEKDHDWANYPKGMIRFIKEAGYTIDSGVDVLFYGNIPNGAGLSSSASIELVTGIMLDQLFNLKISRDELAKIGQKVENEFIGVNSGIMDQFAIALGKKDYGLLLDCDTLHYDYIPLHLDDYRIIIMNTNKRRELADSKYNERRSECEKALRILQQHIDIKYLCDLSKEQLDQLKQHLTDGTIYKRAKHVVLENERTLAAAEALKQGDLSRFGQYLNESHISLRDDYEVTGKELDTIVAAAWEQKGVLGARMTGAGFGGCAIAIVEEDQVDSFIKNVGAIYKAKIGYDASFYNVTLGDGVKEIEEFSTVK